MGYNQAKKDVLKCLKDGLIEHEARDDIDVKNLLYTGEVSIDYVVECIARSSGTDYLCTPHHLSSDIDVHVIKVTRAKRTWYIKWYFLDPNAVFISVH